MNQTIKISRKHSPEVVGFLMLVLITSAAYYGIVDHRFLQWDDVLYIQKNSHIHSLSFENFYWMITNYDQGNWHPVTWLSLALNLSISGYDPVAFKSTNITIHILNCVLIYFLSFNLLKVVRENYHRNQPLNNSAALLKSVSNQHIKTGSIFAALLFAVHPQHVESVTWIAERKDVLCGLFSLSTILSYLQYRVSSKSSWLTFSLLLYLFALMSKSMAVTIPAVLVIMDLYPFRMTQHSNTLREKLLILFKDKISFFILAFVVSIITIITQRSGIQSSDLMPLDTRIINACMSMILYLSKFIWPVNLSPFYPFHPWSTDPQIYSVIPVLAIISAIAICIFLSVKRIYFPLTIACFLFITLLPVIGLIKVGGQAAADRYTYLPFVCLYIALAAGISILLNATKNRSVSMYALRIGFAGVITAMSFATYYTNKFWSDDESLWNRAITLYPGLSNQAYKNLAATYYNDRRFEKARSMYIKALALHPKDAEILEKLGKIQEQSGNDQLGLYYLTEIIRLYPESAYGYMILGDFYYARRQLNQAKELYTRSFKLAPNTAATLQRSALVDFLNNDIRSAIHKIEYLLKLAPSDIGSLQLAAQVQLKANNTEKARQLADKILQINPDDSFAKDIIISINQSS